MKSETHKRIEAEFKKHLGDVEIKEYCFSHEWEDWHCFDVYYIGLDGVNREIRMNIKENSY